VTPADAQRRANYAHAVAFFDAFCAAGVRHVCCSPGSRSTPLTLSAAAAVRECGGRCFVHHDERSAGFFALGMAKALREPVALVCTSGTAAANYLPAVVEAFHAGVPLVVITADRPPELRDRGAGQTIDQQRLFGSHARWFYELAVPSPDGPSPRIARGVAARAVAEAWGRPGGPVHLNWPLREPLDPPASPIEVGARLAELGAEARPVPAIARRDPAPAPGEVEALVALVRRVERGVVACGPNDEREGLAGAVAELARAAGWPLLAEPTSGLRCGPHVAGGAVLGASDLFLRDARFAGGHRPEAVLRIGRAPTSKAQRLWLEAAPPEALWLVDPDQAWHDESALATRWIVADAQQLCRGAAEALRGMPPRAGDWLRDFEAVEAAATRAAAKQVDDDGRLLQPRAVRELAAALPPDAWLYVSNSMPVRDVDAFWPVSRAPLRVLSSRGASGIDGVTSAALGAAAVTDARLCLLTGDLAFLHDVGGLLAARRHSLRATLVVLDDDGGGIFSFLPIAAHGEGVDFEALFRTPHGVDLAHAAALAGARYHRVGSWPEYRDALAAGFSHDGLSIVHVPVDRDANVAQHRAVDAAVARELEGVGFVCAS
jgi:2-succinyl-5-enolpyruvyl-6-hydroxy-3-cyclohexene-1-carboxylate synthase